MGPSLGRIQTLMDQVLHACHKLLTDPPILASRAAAIIPAAASPIEPRRRPERSRSGRGCGVQPGLLRQAMAR